MFKESSFYSLQNFITTFNNGGLQSILENFSYTWNFLETVNFITYFREKRTLWMGALKYDLVIKSSKKKNETILDR